MVRYVILDSDNSFTVYTYILLYVSLQLIRIKLESTVCHSSRSGLLESNVRKLRIKKILYGTNKYTLYAQLQVTGDKSCYISHKTERHSFRGGKMTKSENIFLFVPNIIGYGRVILALVSFYFMPTNYIIALWCYIISALLDAVDGHAARYFNQGTKFGAMLDQLTDRVGTMCLLATLCVLYPSYTFWFQLSMAVDIACHWIYLHTSILQGKSSHKFIDMSENPVMRVYYTNRMVLFIMCAGNEAFYAALYLLYFTEGPILAGISLFRFIMYVSAPIAFLKAGISLLHGYVSCINLSIIDLNDRQERLKGN